MTADELRAYLKQRQVKFDERPVQHGTQFRCTGGEIFCIYQTGRVSFQGRSNTDLAKAVQAWDSSGSVPPAGAPVAEVAPEDSTAVPVGAAGPNRQVFVVYGHDVAAREGLELLLHRMKLEPIVLQNLPAAGDTVIEKLERYLGEHGNVGFACVLLTPDDQGHVAGKPEDMQYRARQNVVLELGMVLARLGRPRVAILHKESVELPSDIAGLIYIPFKERVDEVKAKLFGEFQEAGYTPSSDALSG